MGFKRCRLGKKEQLRLLEYFVLEVTARAAADMLGMQANTTMLFYRKIRHLIAGKLAETFPERGEFGAVSLTLSFLCLRRFGARGRVNDSDFLQTSPVSRRCYPTSGLAVFSIHAELSRRRGVAGGTRHRT